MRDELYIPLFTSLRPNNNITAFAPFAAAMKTIQEQLAEKPSNGDTQPIQYVETVEAYDKWAEVG